jgi:chemotaxis protein CheY-P-specific phosphatase CheC
MIVDQIATQPHLTEPSNFETPEQVVKVGSKRKLYTMYALMLMSSTGATIIAKLMTLNVDIPN